MSEQYAIVPFVAQAESVEMPKEFEPRLLAEQYGSDLLRFLSPLVKELHTSMDMRPLVTFRDSTHGLLLSELGSHLDGLGGGGGTKRLAACRRERTSSHASHSGSACVAHGVRARAPEQSAVTGRTGSERATEWAGRRLPSPREDLDKVWKRLRLKAKQSRHHSPAAAAVPRKEN